jgi:hypothetical protein
VGLFEWRPTGLDGSATFSRSIVAVAPALDFVGMAEKFDKDIQAVFRDASNVSTPIVHAGDIAVRRGADRREVRCP